jgi:hypothetical protein
MTKRVFKPIFKRSLIEQSSLLQTQIEIIQQENLNQGFYNSYRDAQCVTKDLLIHEYPNRKELVKINSRTGNTQTVKIFS